MKTFHEDLENKYLEPYYKQSLICSHVIQQKLCVQNYHPEQLDNKLL